MSQIYQPYTYLIGWSKLDRWYYGCRYSKICNPNELCVTYFTSSKHVKLFIKENGPPDICQIRKIFDNSIQCREWENKVLRRLKVIHKQKWLNKTDNISISSECRGPGPKKGYKRSEESKAKQSLSSKGRKIWNKGLKDDPRCANAAIKTARTKKDRGIKTLAPSQYSGYEPWNKGLKTGPLEEKTKEKMRGPRKKKGPMSEITKEKLRKPNEKKKLAAKNRSQIILICPHCNKSGDVRNMKRWHFDNCKIKK